MSMTTHNVEVAIVGAGFSGLGAAIKMSQNGFTDYVILDRGADFGGTWRDNTYPGAACDVASNLYSYSFAPNPEWSRSYSHQPEIHRYINDVADRFGVRDKARFGVEVTRAAWSESQQRWLIDTVPAGTDPSAAAVTTYRAQHLIGAVGPLCEPNLPDIDGIESFGGTVMHSARWDDDVELSGKRVAVIGTGASAIQIVPEVAKRVAHLDVYQRTAPWIVPRTERPYTPVEHWLFKNAPIVQSASRAGVYAFNEFIAFGLTHSRKALKPVEIVARANIARGIRDRKLRDKVTPRFQVGCKRILRSNAWYPALDRPNVDLVTDPIARVTPSGIVTADGTEREIDVLIVATGFHVTDSPVFDCIVGAEGHSLAQAWDKNGMQGYKGSFVHGFPNMMLMVGPATGLGHTSMVYMIESQLNYLVDYLKTVRAQGITRVDVDEKSQRGYNSGIQHALRHSVWVNGGCASWYADDNGNITTLWPGFTFNFRKQTRRFDLAAYDVARDSSAADTPAVLASTRA